MCYTFFQAITVSITESGPPLFKQNGYNLTCDVNGTEYFVSDSNHSIKYQWTKINGILTTATDTKVLSFSSLELSDGGIYTCKVNVSSTLLSYPATAMNSHSLYLQSELYLNVIMKNIMHPYACSSPDGSHHKQSP